MMATRLKSLLAGARALGPYALVELVLPGGTLIAAALWLYQRRRNAGSEPAVAPATDG